MAKPPISEWIVRERKAHGWKVAELSRRLRDMGYQAEESTVQVWEAGRSPRAETIEALERLFGSQAPREQADNSDLAAAIRALEQAIQLQSALLGEALRVQRGQAPSQEIDQLIVAAVAAGSSLAGISEELPEDPPGAELVSAQRRRRS